MGRSFLLSWTVPRSGSARDANEHALASTTRGGCFHPTGHPTEIPHHVHSFFHDTASVAILATATPLDLSGRTCARLCRKRGLRIPRLSPDPASPPLLKRRRHWVRGSEFPTGPVLVSRAV